ncbi:lysozyme inhibitor LprI family protein [Paraburkholderia sp. RG36]|uniref:Lysozyme inhibitor LprI family protein n=2 Tax=Paraburkholderia tagetis TaxID=2913261 RepID=A0A9X1RT28_9BURK|nr:lysozyme inhibitor LprI family protein [Paraburkholderia tagetis]MCG5075347.1 lysozyme inhibitor LprI family protein [Paraburkholderia tagetis]
MALAATLGMAPAAHAEVAAADPIDAGMRTCLARADRSSTAGQIQCMDEARTAWRGAADAALTQLIAKLPPAQQKRWRLSQTKWAAWRDAEDTMLGAAFATTSGSTYQLYEADMRLQPVRERALALRGQVGAAADDAPPRVRACSADARCEHVSYDLNRYYRRLYARMPAHTRPALSRAQSAWRAYRDATTPLIDERTRLDLLGARLATLKRLSETVNNR